jgi:phosphopantothenoylcysteine synthetase/decarboxylase
LLAVTGAPLAVRTADIATALMTSGWSVRVVATAAASAWIDTAAVKDATGHDVHVDYRRPEEPKRGPEPDAVIVCPATFNSLNKVASGIADNYAVGVICEAIGQGLPVVVFPMINDRLWKHPARPATFDALKRAGVTFRDVSSGQEGGRPVASGTGALVVDRFKPIWVVTALA